MLHNLIRHLINSKNNDEADQILCLIGTLYFIKITISMFKADNEDIIKYKIKIEGQVQYESQDFLLKWSEVLTEIIFQLRFKPYLFRNKNLSISDELIVNHLRRI